MQKKGLGRGLGELMDFDADSTGASVVSLALAEIRANRGQPRKHFEAEALAELAASIRENGLIQPIIVRKNDAGGYVIIAGERRYRAVESLGWTSIDAIVKDIEELEAAKLAIIENVQREDLNPLEEAEAYRMLRDHYALTQELISSAVGKSRSYISNLLRLLALPEDVQESISTGEMTAAHGKLLAGIEEEDRQAEIAKKIREEKLSVRQTQELLEKDEPRRRKRRKVEIIQTFDLQDPYIKEVERDLSEHLGTKVEVLGTEKSGRIYIEYYNSEDLSALVDLLRGEG